MERSFIVLTYHDISLHETATSVSPETFETTITYLKKQGFQFLTLRDAVFFCKEKRLFPVKTIVLTFDDTYKSHASLVYPILEQEHVPATFFIWTNEVSQPGRLTWEDIKMLNDAHMEIGAHTLTHPDLRNLAEKDMAFEIDQSKRVLEEKLGMVVSSFAYPYNSLPQEAVLEVKKSGYTQARTSITGKNYCKDDMFTLKSFIVNGSLDRTLEFIEKK